MPDRRKAGSSAKWILTILMGAVILFVDSAHAQDAEFERHEIDVLKTKCEVCKTAVKILFKEVEGTDPAKVVEIGSFRLQADGTTKQKKVPYRGSEVQLHDLLDDGKICGGMQNYVPVTDKDTGLPMMINMAEDMDMLGRVKFNPNPDFNSKMNTLCEEIMGDHDETLASLFKSKFKYDGIKVSPIEFGREFCIKTAQLCDPDDRMDALKPKVNAEKVKAANLQPGGSDQENDEDDDHESNEVDDDFETPPDGDFDFDGEDNAQKDEL